MNDNLMSGFKSRTGTSDTHAGDNTINPMGTAQSGSENPSRGGASQMNPMSSKTASSSGQHGGMGDTAEQQMRGTTERIGDEAKGMFNKATGNTNAPDQFSKS